MKTEVKKIDSTKREINIEVIGDVVKNKFEDVFKKIAQEAKVPGFRPGNAPRDILEKNYAALAHEQVLKELVPDIYNQAIQTEKIDCLDLLLISEVKLDRSRLSFKATIEVAPEIKIANYKGIKLNYKKISVTADEIKRNLDSLKETRKLDSIDDNFAKTLSYPNLGELEKTIDRQILAQKDEQRHRQIEEEIINSITKGLDFKLPQVLVDRQLEDLLKQAKVNLAMKGFPRERIEEQEKELVKNLQPEARSQVQVYLILAEIAKKENIAQDDHMPRKVMEFLLKEADWNITE